MTITFVGQAGIAGALDASPQTVTYSSTPGNTLVITGYFLDTIGSACFPASITDSSGANTWQVSTGNATNPPTQGISESGQTWCSFVAWVIDAAGVGTVTIARADAGNPGTDLWWRLALSEWAGPVSAVSANAGTGTSSASFALPSVTLDSTGDLVIAAVSSPTSGTVSVPSGWTQFTSQGANYAGYILPGTTGSYTATWSATVADIWGGAVAVFTPLGSPGPVGNPAGGPWTACFADEFTVPYPTPSGTGPNPAVWADHLVQGDYWRTNTNSTEVEWGSHNSRGFSQSGSLLTITAREESPYSVGPGYDPLAPDPLPSGNAAAFTTGFMQSKPGFSMSYGFFESRLRFASGSPGIWPAFWLQAADRDWPPEVDIQEFNASGLGNETSTYIPNPETGPLGGPYTPSGTIDYTVFHVYGVAILPAGVQFYFDGVPLGSEYTNEEYLDNYPWVITFNLAVRNDGGGYPYGSGYPATMDIDYARAWTLSGVPAQPVITSVSPAGGVPTAGSLTVTFGSVSGATSYRATPCPADGGTNTSDEGPASRLPVTGSSSPLTMTGLTDGTEYVVTVAAVNGTGYSIESLPVPSLAPSGSGLLTATFP